MDYQVHLRVVKCVVCFTAFNQHLYVNQSNKAVIKPNDLLLKTHIVCKVCTETHWLCVLCTPYSTIPPCNSILGKRCRRGRREGCGAVLQCWNDSCSSWRGCVCPKLRVPPHRCGTTQGDLFISLLPSELACPRERWPLCPSSRWAVQSLQHTAAWRTALRGPCSLSFTISRFLLPAYYPLLPSPQLQLLLNSQISLSFVPPHTCCCCRCELHEWPLQV